MNFHFDPTISLNLGTIIQIVLLAIGLIVGWTKMKGRLAFFEFRLTQIDASIENVQREIKPVAVIQSELDTVRDKVKDLDVEFTGLKNWLFMHKKPDGEYSGV